MSYNSLEYILNMEYKPTIKQLKLTNAYRFSDYKFKNIAIQMYQSIVSKIKAKEDSNINNIITSIFNGFSMKKAKDILISISDEHYQKLENKRVKNTKILNNSTENRFEVNNIPIFNKSEYVVTQDDIDEWDKI
jgi:hypothetical protein